MSALAVFLTRSLLDQGSVSEKPSGSRCRVWFPRVKGNGAGVDEDGGEELNFARCGHRGGAEGVRGVGEGFLTLRSNCCLLPVGDSQRSGGRWHLQLEFAVRLPLSCSV